MSRVDAEREAEEIDASLRKRTSGRRSKTWYVCYTLNGEKATSWRMLRISAQNEDDAWKLTLRKLRKENAKFKDDAEKIYIKCVDV